MTKERIVRLSNIVGITAIIALIYWVFIFISIEVLGFKIFKENLTQTFFMSVLGILALMVGTLMLNVMMNLTIMASRNANAGANEAPKRSRFGLIVLLSFPVILGLLWVGDYLSSQKRERFLISSANMLINKHSAKMKMLAAYKYDLAYVSGTQNALELLSNTEKNLPNIYIIVSDTLEGTSVRLKFDQYGSRDTLLPAKSTFLYPTAKDEEEYFETVFEGKNMSPRFLAHDWGYELFYPYQHNGKKIVLYFSDRERYGKLGS